MFVYIIGTVISVLFTYIASNIGKSYHLQSKAKLVLPKFFAFLSFFTLAFIMAVRYNVGTDFLGYERSYVNGYTGYISVEPGFLFLMDTLKKISKNPQTIFIATSIIICSAYFIMIYKESVLPWYSVLMFVLCKDYFISMNIIRQYVATSIAIFSIPYYKKKEWVKVALILMMAFMFHKSVVVFLIVYVLNIFEITPVVVTAILTVMVVAAEIIRKYLLIILQKIDFYAGYFSSLSHFNNKERYFNWPNAVIFLCLFIMLAYEYNSVKKSQELKLMYTGVIYSLGILLLSFVLPTVVERLSWHMNSLIILYTPLAVRSIHNKKIGKFLKIAIPISYAYATFYKILAGNQDVLPYQVFWNFR